APRSAKTIVDATATSPAPSGANPPPMPALSTRSTPSSAPAVAAAAAAGPTPPTRISARVPPAAIAARSASTAQTTRIRMASVDAAGRVGARRRPVAPLVCHARAVGGPHAEQDGGADDRGDDPGDEEADGAVVVALAGQRDTERGADHPGQLQERLRARERAGAQRLD